MASIVLSTVGSAVGGEFGGPPGAYLGARLGRMLGNRIDNKLFGEPMTKHVGPRLSELGVQSSTYGKMIPIVYGNLRISGDWQDRADVPLGEEREAYEVDIMAGGDVVRTLSASGNGVPIRWLNRRRILARRRARWRFGSTSYRPWQGVGMARLPASRREVFSSAPEILLRSGDLFP